MGRFLEFGYYDRVAVFLPNNYTEIPLHPTQRQKAMNPRKPRNNPRIGRLSGVSSPAPRIGRKETHASRSKALKGGCLSLMEYTWPSSQHPTPINASATKSRPNEYFAFPCITPFMSWNVKHRGHRGHRGHSRFPGEKGPRPFFFPRPQLQAELDHSKA